MPTIGYYLGNIFTDMILSYNYWIAFVLLSLIGGNMIKESRETDDCPDANMTIPAMFALAIATSIDSLAVGVTFDLWMSLFFLLPFSLAVSHFSGLPSVSKRVVYLY